MSKTNSRTRRPGSSASRLRGPRAALHTEAVGAQLASRDSATRGRLQLGCHWRSGGTEGNETLTSAAAAVLVLLLVAEGITIVHMRGLLMVPAPCARCAQTGPQRDVMPCPALALARAMLMAAAVGGGVALAIALLPTIQAYSGH